MYQYYNPNPIANRTDDCVVRAIAAAFNVTWDDAFDAVAANAKAMGEVMQSDHAWGALLRQFGFEKDLLPDTCPDCYTVGDFADDHPHGVYVDGSNRSYEGAMRPVSDREGYSERNRDRMGRYSRADGGYSGHSSEELLDAIEKMLQHRED